MARGRSGGVRLTAPVRRSTSPIRSNRTPGTASATSSYRSPTSGRRGKPDAVRSALADPVVHARDCYQMTRWQKHARLGVGVFGIAFAIIVYAAIGDRQTAIPSPAPRAVRPPGNSRKRRRGVSAVPRSQAGIRHRSRAAAHLRGRHDEVHRDHDQRCATGAAATSWCPGGRAGRAERGRARHCR